MVDHANVYPADIDHDYDDHHVKYDMIIMMMLIMISRWKMCVCLSNWCERWLLRQKLQGMPGLRWDHDDYDYHDYHDNWLS